MSWFGQLLPDKISERSFLAFIILILGIILSITGAAEKIEINKISFVIQVTNLYLKIIITITGVSLISFGSYFLLMKNNEEKLEHTDNRIKIDLQEEIEEKIKKILEKNDMVNRIKNVEDILHLNNFAIHANDRSNNKAFCLIDKQLNCSIETF